MPGSALSVCLYTPSIDPSGMGVHMVELARQLVPRAEVAVMDWGTPAGRRMLQAAAAVGARTVALPRPRSRDFGRHVAAWLRENPTDVFHAHVGTGRENWAGAHVARALGVPAVVETVHLPWLLGSPKHRVPFFASIAPLDRLVTVSQAQRRTYERIGVPPGLLATVPNGMAPRGSGAGREEARRALGLRPEQLVVLSVGRLHVQKGHRVLVEAAGLLRDRSPELFRHLAFVVLGEGPLRDGLERRAAELGVDGSVVLAGHRPDARALLDAADVFALPSRQEAMPMAAIEAMDAGLPVVATDVIGTAEVVDHGRTGLLVPRDDPAALAAALAEVLQSPHLRRRFADAGRARYQRCFTADLMAERTLAVYEDALVRARVGQPA